VELGQQMGIDRAPMVQHIDYLEQRGLVKRTLNPRDRRAHQLMLTDKGREVLAQALALARRVEAEVLAPLSAEEQAQLNHLMNRLLASHFISDG
jgi:DNA-binding MarR family transcriptional regulator